MNKYFLKVRNKYKVVISLLLIYVIKANNINYKTDGVKEGN